jgi:MFS family permease
MKKWRKLIVLACAAFIMVIDSTSMNVSISNLVADLNTDLGTIQMIMSVYTLIMASLMLPCAKLADIIGKKKTFKLGVCIYGVGTLTAAIAPNAGVLFVGWALIEGIAAAMMMPSAMSLIASAYDGSERATAMGVYTAVGAVGVAIGPIFGGLITTMLSWRYIFALEVLIVVYIILGFKEMDKIEVPETKGESFDFFSTVMLMAGLVGIIGGCLAAKTNGWFIAKQGAAISVGGLSITLILLVFGFLLVALFFIRIASRKKRGKPALMDVALFKSRVLGGVLLINILVQTSMVGIMYITPVYLQNVNGYTALQTGLTLLPLSLILFFASLVAVRLAKRFRFNYIVCGGAAAIAAGAVYQFFLYSGPNAVTGTALVVPMILLGLGIGSTISLTANEGISSVDPSLSNQASGTISTVNNLGSSFATAIFGSMLVTGLFANVAQFALERFPQITMSADELAYALQTSLGKMSGGTINATPEQLQNARQVFLESLNASVASILLIIAAISIICAAVSIAAFRRSKSES